MTIKVIKPGIVPKPIINLYRGVCHVCNAVVEFDEPDTIEECYTPHIKCPTYECSAFITGAEKIGEATIQW